ncbi:hypothetical protein [Actinokineospora globicatena]|uniref:hypothetical protein n=1 Tax=Actinokineospora globicatena TaxID=103729 RepID=UPI0025530823|nr:hypothetical protein [Actinokineospora globicatena]
MAPVERVRRAAWAFVWSIGADAEPGCWCLLSTTTSGPSLAAGIVDVAEPGTVDGLDPERPSPDPLTAVGAVVGPAVCRGSGVHCRA